MSKRFVGTVAVVLGGLAAFSWARPASAQEWLKDRRFQNGAGYRAGDVELHPGIAAEIGYDSNWFLRSDKTGFVNSAPAAPPEGAAVLRITPSLNFTTTQARQRTEGEPQSEGPSVVVSGGVAGTYREFFSGDEVLRRQRNMSVDANLRLDALPGRPWGASVFATFNRFIQPTYTGDPNLSFNRDDLGAGAEIIAQPNSGTLDWRLGYMFHTTLFEETEGHPFDNLTHAVYTRGRWKFRPRTALLYDGSLSFRSYSHPDGAITPLHQSTPARARIGITGLVTPRLAIMAMAGYAATFYDTNGGKDPTTQQYDSVIGQAEVKFFPTANPASADPSEASLVLSSIALGFVRDYQASYLGDFYGTDRGYLNVAYFFAGRALVSLEGGVGTIEYPTIYFNPPGNPPAIQASPFTDIRADATLFGEYRFVDSVGINATLRYTENFSNTSLPSVAPTVPGAASAGRYDLSWRRFEAYLGVRWFM